MPPRPVLFSLSSISPFLRPFRHARPRSSPPPSLPLHRTLCTPPSLKRVLGVVAHINSGKTTLSEAMLFHSGALRRQGNVDAGDTLLDFLPLERQRGITISAAAAVLHHRDHTLFLVDSPGHLDFTYEVERALRVMDAVVVVLDAVQGIQPQTETVWRQADANRLPRLVFVNKMDRDGADLHAVARALSDTFGVAPLVLSAPVWAANGRDLQGVFDLVRLFPLSPSARDPRETDDAYLRLNDAQRASVDAAASALVEAVADLDDAVMACYLDELLVPLPLLRAAIRGACLSRAAVPLLCGSALRGVGVDEVLDGVVEWLPSPVDREQVVHGKEFVAYAFKVTHDRHRGRLVHMRVWGGEGGGTAFWNTTKGGGERPTKLLRVRADAYEEVDKVATGDIFAAVGLKKTATGDTLVLQHAPQSSRVVLDPVRTPPAVFSVALQVDSSSEEKQLEVALQRLVEEDCSLETRVDDETGETLLSGMGELHLEVAVDHLCRMLKFSVRMSKPRVAYREAVGKEVNRPQRYDSTIGSLRFQAALQVAVTPIEGGNFGTTGNEVEIDAEAFSTDEREAIREGVEAALGRGPVLGAPVTGARVSIAPVADGSAHGRQNTTALRACSSTAVRNALRDCAPLLLEPVMSVQCVIPDHNAGDIISELSHPTRRRGTIESVELAEGDEEKGEERMNKKSKIRAMVPLDGVIGWATKMRSITKGRGDFSATFAKYRAVDEATTKRILSASESM